jgi:hypothetical protein
MSDISLDLAEAEGVKQQLQSASEEVPSGDGGGCSTDTWLSCMLRYEDALSSLSEAIGAYKETLQDQIRRLGTSFQIFVEADEARAYTLSVMGNTNGDVYDAPGGEPLFP